MPIQSTNPGSASQSFRLSPQDPGAAGGHRASHSTSATKQEVLWQRLLAHMVEDRPYLDPLLMQRDLAERFNISTRTLCRLVTQHTDDNFNTFINRYRVEEACRLMYDPQYAHFSVEVIAMQAGFNSRGSFYRAFKAIVGTSPAQYRHRRE